MSIDPASNGRAGLPLRLCDLISALRSRQAKAKDLLSRVEPAIFDELHALAAHRGVEVDDLAAEFLEALVVEAADAAWRIGVARMSLLSLDPEAALLGSALDNAMQVRLRRELRIATSRPGITVHFGFIRSGPPYTRA